MCSLTLLQDFLFQIGFLYELIVLFFRGTLSPNSTENDHTVKGIKYFAVNSENISVLEKNNVFTLAFSKNTICCDWPAVERFALERLKT